MYTSGPKYIIIECVYTIYATDTSAISSSYYDRLAV